MHSVCNFVHILLATPNVDYVDIKKNVTLITGLSALQDGKLCTEVLLLNDDILENNENFYVLLTPTLENRQIVAVSMGRTSEEVSIIEDPNDGMHA